MKKNVAWQPHFQDPFNEEERNQDYPNYEKVTGFLLF